MYMTSDDDEARWDKVTQVGSIDRSLETSE